MTIRDLEISEGEAPLEVIPAEAKEIEIRHLAVGASMMTFCGLERTGLLTVHPSKARKTDCLACRNAYRLDKAAPGALRSAGDAPLKYGDYVENPDGSVWEVTHVSHSSATVKCVVSSDAHPKGQVTNISPNSALRVFTIEEYVALKESLAQVAEVNREEKGPRKTGKWAPTQAEVDKVHQLRVSGMSYIAIETTMNWPEGHGNRPWRIVTGKLTARK